MSKFSEFGNDLYTGKRSINFVGRRKVFYAVAAIMIVLAVVLPTLRGGFNFGIEFRGGSEFRVAGVSNSSQQIAVDAVHQVEPEAQPLVSNVGTDAIRVQTEQLTDVKSEEVRVALAQAYGVESSAVTGVRM
jgi:preprotein translocase subunit SecF